MTTDDQWIQDFNDRVKAIQIEYDAFLKSRDLADYYHFHQDESGKLISMHFLQVHGLPKQIEDALMEAFIKSKPSQ